MKSSLPKKEHRGVFDVIRPAERKVVRFFERYFTSRYVLNLRRRWLMRPEVLTIGAFLGIALVVLGMNQVFTRATVQDFYPRTCLGSWERTERAQGKPESFGVSGVILTRENASAYPGGNTEIFCGNFLDENSAAEGDITHVGLTLLWNIGEEEGSGFVPAPLTEIPVAPPTETPPSEISEPQTASSSPEEPKKDAPAEPPVTPSSTPDEPLPTEPVVNEPVPDAPPPAETPAPSEPELPTAPLEIPPQSAPAEPQLPANEPNPTPAEIPPPPPAENAVPTTWLPLIRRAFAQELSAETTTVITAPPIEVELGPLNTEEPGTSPSDTTTTIKEAEPMTFPEAPKPDEHFLEVSWSTDGETWTELQRVNAQNWQNLTLAIPVHTWEELKNLQVRVAGIPTTLAEKQQVLLDGMLLEVKSEMRPLHTENDAEEEAQISFDQFPVIKLDPAKKPMPLKRTGGAFGGGEAAIFDFDLGALPDLGTQESGTTTASTTPEFGTTSTPPEAFPSAAPEESAPPDEKPTSRTPAPHAFRTLGNFFLNLLGTRAEAQGTSGISPTLRDPVIAEIFDPAGIRVNVKPSFLTVNQKLRVSVPEPDRALRPGKYTMKLRILRNGTVYETENDFLWGVLAVNFNKSVYTKGDTAQMGIGVLNDLGETICNAEVTAVVTDPNGKTQTFMTQSGTIITSPACGPNSVTNAPDYGATFTAGEIGEYLVRVTALTPNGTREVEEKFSVEAQPIVDIERTGPTRIYPPASYSVALRIKANADFQGTVTEFVPAGFVITSYQLTQQSTGAETKEIEWRIALHAGEEITLGYSFQAPPISPEFWKLGPLTFIENGGKTFFKETRKWQIASDAVTAAGTFYWGAGGAGGVNGIKVATFSEPNTRGTPFDGPTTATITSTVWVVARTSPTRNERLIGSIRSNVGTSTLHVVRCTGGCDAAGDMSELFLLTDVGTAANTVGAECDNSVPVDACVRPFDIAYEPLSGKAMVVYARRSTNNKLFYRTWDGVSSSTEQTFVDFGASGKPITAAGVVNWVTLKPRGEQLGIKRTNEILYGFSTINEDIGVGIWDGDVGTSSIAMHQVTTNSTNNNVHPGNFDVAWETESGNAMVGFGSASTTWQYKTMASTTRAWSASSTINTVNDLVTADYVMLESDPSTDRIMAALTSDTDEIQLAVWRATTSTASWTLGTTDASTETMINRQVGTAWGKSATGSVNFSMYSDAAVAPVWIGVAWTPGGGFSVQTATTTQLTDDSWGVRLVGSPNSANIMALGRSGDTCGFLGKEYNVDTGWQLGLAEIITTTSSYSAIGTVCPGTWTPASSTFGTPQPYHFTYNIYSPWGMNWRWYADTTDSTPSAGSALAAENATGSVSGTSNKLRLRMNFREVGGVQQTDSRKTLQFTTSTNPNASSSVWHDVTTGGGIWKYASPGFCSPSSCTDNTVLAATTLTSSTQSGAYVRDSLRSTTFTNMDHNAGAVVEYEFQINIVATSSNTYYFRAFDIEQNTPIYRYQDSAFTATCAGATACIYPSITYVANNAPTVSNAVLNAGNTITLTAYTSTTISVVASSTDAQGVGDIRYATGTIYRTSLGSSCTHNAMNCYQIASSSCSFTDSTSTARCAASIWYFADATDTSSSFSSDTWKGTISVTDASGASDTTSTNVTVELSTLLALEVATTSISYGQFSASSTSGSSTQIVSIFNVGNASSNLLLSGTALRSGGNSMPTSSQRYATSTFTVGGNEQQLQQTATVVSGATMQRFATTTLGTWQQTLPITHPSDGVPITQMGVASWKDYLYSIGGTMSENSAQAANGIPKVYYIQVSPTGTLIDVGSGDWYDSTRDLPNAVFENAAVAYNSYLYNTGGHDINDNSTSAVHYAQISQSGALGAWTAANSMPYAVGEHALVAHRGYLYAIGGLKRTDTGTTKESTSTVAFTAINSDGSLGTWATTTSLDGNRYEMGAVAIGDYLYVIGGVSSTANETSETTRAVRYALINANGTLGAWASSTIPGSDTTRNFGRAGAVLHQGSIFARGTPTQFPLSQAMGRLYATGIPDLTNWLPTTNGTSTGGTDVSHIEGGIISSGNTIFIVGGSAWMGNSEGSDFFETTSTVWRANIDSSKHIHWGITIPPGQADGTYESTITFGSQYPP